MEGILIVDKPSGITSFDVIRELRKILKEKKMGHTGTLDPLATGLLIICIGKATKLCQSIEGLFKTYEAEFELGFKTDTLDITGKILKKSDKDIKDIDIENIKNVLQEFVGDIKQIPPMYSAIKIGGKKLYELARLGKEIERPPRDVTINNIELLNFFENKINISCEVSKGTYIRTLIDDIGERLGTYATMTNLKRTKIGEVSIKDAFTIDKIKKMCENDKLDFICPVVDFFNYEKILLKDEIQKKLYTNGNCVKFPGEDGFYSVYYQNIFLGLASISKNTLKGYKYF